ncbi:MAG: hypothetical protein ACHQQQ_01990 [Bacteroidota bacterium]
MNHIDEHTLELFILRAEAVEGQRAEIEAHLAACRGCKDLADEIAAFHTELKDELTKPRIPVTRAERAIARRNENLAPFHDLYGVPMPYLPQTRVQKFTRFVFRHPITSGAGVLGLAAGLALLINVATKLDRNPAYVFMNPANGMFEVMNHENGPLWQRPLPQFADDKRLEDVMGNRCYAVTDREGNGVNEILTTLMLGGEPPVPQKGVNIFDGAGNLIKNIPFQEYPSFRGTRYNIPNEITGQALIVDTVQNNKLNEIYISVSSGRSPNVLLRMDKNGNVLGEYWHFGNFQAMYSCDINNDGNNEIILCGLNDVDDEKKPSMPVIAVVNPKKLVGEQESSCSRGFGDSASTAEIMYIRLPQSELTPIFKQNTVVQYMRQSDSIIQFTCGVENDNVHYDFEYTFTPDLRPLKVKSTSWTTTMYNKLFKEGKIPHLIDQAYLDNLKNSIRYWDGKNWRKERTEIQHQVSTRLP